MAARHVALVGYTNSHDRALLVIIDDEGKAWLLKLTAVLGIHGALEHSAVRIGMDMTPQSAGTVTTVSVHSADQVALRIVCRLAEIVPADPWMAEVFWSGYHPIWPSVPSIASLLTREHCPEGKTRPPAA